MRGGTLDAMAHRKRTTSRRSITSHKEHETYSRDLEAFMFPLSEETMSEVNSTQARIQAEIVSRLLNAKERYPDPPVALKGERLLELTEDYARLGIALDRLLTLRNTDGAVERILKTDPQNPEARTLRRELLFFEGLVLIAQSSLVPYLERVAVVNGLDPSPFRICWENLTPDSRAKAIALSARIALLSEKHEHDPWIPASVATRRSGLSADTIRKRAERDHWPVEKIGRMNAYRLSDLERAWSKRNFRTDK